MSADVGEGSAVPLALEMLRLISEDPYTRDTTRRAATLHLDRLVLEHEEAFAMEVLGSISEDSNLRAGLRVQARAFLRRLRDGVAG